MKQQQQQQDAPDLRVAVLGNVDSGKSTLVGVLSKYVLDDGRGLARMRVLQHQHEKDKGQTSTVALEVVGYDQDGAEVRPPNHIHHQHVKELHHVASRSSRLVSIIDLCGHEHFLKTTVFGLMGLVPDMVVLVVGGNAGVQKMTREHLGLAVALHLPVCVVVTKIDMAPEGVLDDSLKRVDRILRVAGRKKYGVGTAHDCLLAAQAMSTSHVVAPVFQLSCVSGQGLDLLRQFLQHLACDAECEGLAGHSIRGGDNPDQDDDHDETNCEMQIDNTYNVPGVGTVVSGSVFHGQLVAGARLLLGPDEAGEFKEAKVQSVHRQCVPVDRAFSGQQCTAAIKLVRGHHLLKPRKGLVLLSLQRMDLLRREQDGVVAVRTFDCQVRILHHTTTIQPGYMPIIHLGTVRQSAIIEHITHGDEGEDGEDVEEATQALRTGSVAVVRFRFAYRPEFVTVGRPLVFREGTTKGVGKVLQLVS